MNAKHVVGRTCKNPTRWVSYVPWVGPKQGGLRFHGVRDHDPPHVHVYSDEGVAKVLLGTDSVEVAFADAEMKRVDVRRARFVVEEHFMECWAAWKKYHG